MLFVVWFHFGMKSKKEKRNNFIRCERRRERNQINTHGVKEKKEEDPRRKKREDNACNTSCKSIASLPFKSSIVTLEALIRVIQLAESLGKGSTRVSYLANDANDQWFS